MKAWFDVCVRIVRGLFSALFSFVLWTFWLGLTVLLCFQLYIVSANELTIPDFVLRHVETRLADSGIRATFSRTAFDPAGRVLIEDVKLSLPAFAEPVVTVRSAFLRLNPWFLAVGRIEPREIRLTGVNAFVPAMLSRSGRPEEIVRDLDTTLEPARRAVAVDHLTAHIAGVPVTAHGTLMLGVTRDEPSGLERLSELITRHFPTVCRRALALSDYVAQFEEPVLQLEFTPSVSGAATIHVLAQARAARLPKPFPVEAANLRASTRLLLFGDAPPSNVEFTAGELTFPDIARITRLDARIIGRLRIKDVQFDLREVAATADAASASGADIDAIATRVFPQRLPRVETHAVATVLGSPLAMSAELDVAKRDGLVRFDGTVSSRVIDYISQRQGVNVRKFIDFQQLMADHAEVRFGPGLKFEKLTAHVRIPRLKAHGVTMEDSRAEIELDPNRLYSPNAFARVGANFAQGTYEHDLKTNHYRFLLAGRLQPLAISPWFRDWWSKFFRQFEFRRTPPVANVDVRGSWGDGRQSNVFVFADAPDVLIRGTELDRVRTRLFIRPAFFDGLEVLALRGKGTAHGRFTYVGDPATHAWHTLDLGVDSTLDLSVARQLLGPGGERALGQFRLAQPPEVRLRGQFAAPAAPGGEREKMRIEAKTAGEFRFHDFPLQDVSFVATLDRDDIVLDDVQALFAGGKAQGHARVWGAGAQRRLGFDVALQSASLGKVAAGLGEFFAARKGGSPSPPGKYVQEKADVQLTLAASAEGRYDDPLSFRGDGSAMLHGAEIGEVPLLGLLSELLKFTALRFTEARGNFKIENTRLIFPEVTLRGANSAIDAHGIYALDRRELEFNAKIFPFQESENLLKTVVGAVLTPLSNALEVKLTGTLVKPEWSFVMGPTNFLRSLSGGDADNKVPPTADDKDVKLPRATANEPLPNGVPSKS